MTCQSESLPITTPTRGPLAEPFSAIDVSSQERGGVPGTLSHLVSIPAQGRDVTHLSPWAYLFAVHVDPHPRVVREAVQVAGVHVAVVAAQDVGHHDVWRGHRGVTEGKVEHGAQVLLELAGSRALDGPVPAVVRAHGELVDEH